MVGGSNGSAIDDKVVDATLNTYYPTVVASADRARARAQAAYTISSATAAALVTAGALAGLRSLAAPVQIVGGIALLGWLMSAAFFMAVSKEVKPIHAGEKGKPPTPEMLDAGEFVVRVLAEAKNAEKKVEARLNRAVITSWIAMAMTALVFLLSVVLPPPGHIEEVVLNLSPVGEKIVAEACGTSSDEALVELDVTSLENDFVVLRTPEGVCGQDEELLLVPSSAVETVEQPRGKFPFFP